MIHGNYTGFETSSSSSSSSRPFAGEKWFRFAKAAIIYRAILPWNVFAVRTRRRKRRKRRKDGIGGGIKGEEWDAINSIPIFVIANLMDEIPRCVSSFRFIENRYRCMLSREHFSPLFPIVYQHRLSVKVLLCRLVVRVPLAPWLRSSGKSQYRDRSRGFFSRGISIFFLPRVRCFSS